jgi:hypothetical protein
MTMQFLAKCAASVSKNGASFVLLRFEPDQGHLIGEIAKELGELKQGRIYLIKIEEQHDAK